MNKNPLFSSSMRIIYITSIPIFGFIIYRSWGVSKNEHWLLKLQQETLERQEKELKKHRT